MRILVCLLLVVTSAQVNETTDEPVTMTTPWATVNADILGFLTGYLPEDYYVPENIYAWNISEIITIVEGNSPGLFCSAPIELFSSFPTEVLKDIPLWAKYCHEMWCFANESEWQAVYGLTYDELGVKCNGTLALSAGCPYPLVATNAWSEFGPCGVACEYSGLLHGYTQAMMDSLRVAKWLMFVTCVAIMCVRLFNQWMDAKEKKKQVSFFERPFLNQSTFGITLSFLLVAFATILPEIVGVDWVLCDANGNNPKIVSLGNPKAGWTPCTVFGLFFYFCWTQLAWYNAVFSLCLWSNFSDPFDKRKQAIERFLHERNMDWAIEYLLEDKRMWHLAMALVTVAFCVAAYVKDAIDAYHVMGICFTGAGGQKNLMFWLDMFPAGISTLVLTFCLVHGFYLLVRQRRSFADHSTERVIWNQLGVRMGLFAFGMGTSWFMFSSFIFQVYFNSEKIADSSKKRIFCVFEHGGSKNACYDEGYRVPQAQVYLAYLCQVVACSTGLFLSFHVAAFRRWAGYCPCAARLGCCEAFMGTELAEAASLDRATVLSKSGAGSKRSRRKERSSKGSSKGGTKLSKGPSSRSRSSDRSGVLATPRSPTSGGSGTEQPDLPSTTGTRTIELGVMSDRNTITRTRAVSDFEMSQ